MTPGAAIRLSALWPEIIVLLAGCAALLLGISSRSALRRAVPAVSLLALVFGLIVLAFAGTTGAQISANGNGLTLGGLADFVRRSALVFGVLVVLIGWSQPQSSERGEFFGMMLFSLAGLMLVGGSSNLVVLFLALELVSIPSYALVTLSRSSPLALEAGTKYFYLGAMSAAINAYGFSFLYGATGTATLDETFVINLQTALNSPLTHAAAGGGAGLPSLTNVVAVLGILLSVAGLLFKIAAVPLHLYIADVYQGAANSVAGFLGFVPKLAGFVAISRVLQSAGWNHLQDGGMFWVFWLLAAASMTVGNVLALRQTNVKRLLAYSGVAHSGYMLVGLMVGPFSSSGFVGDGTAAVLYYAVVYGIANLAAFGILGVLRRRGRACESVRDLAGLVRSQPGAALAMSLAMFTLMGMPPTPGFWGKIGLFGSALAQAPNYQSRYEYWMFVLVVIALLNSALAAAYYLRVIAACLLAESDESTERSPRELEHVGTIMCTVFLVVFSFYPGGLIGAGRGASESLRSASAVPPPPIASADTSPTP